MKRLFRPAIITFLCFGLVGAALAKDTPMTLDQLPVPEAFSPRVPLGPAEQVDAQASFVAEVSQKLKGEGFAIAEQRIFNCVGYDPKQGPQWVILHAEVGNALMENFKGEEIYDHMDATGPHHLSIWKIRGGQVVAISQTYALPDGNALVGYFVLKKE